MKKAKMARLKLGVLVVLFLVATVALVACKSGYEDIKLGKVSRVRGLFGSIMADSSQVEVTLADRSEWTEVTKNIYEDDQSPVIYIHKYTQSIL